MDGLCVELVTFFLNMQTFFVWWFCDGFFIELVNILVVFCFSYETELQNTQQNKRLVTFLAAHNNIWRVRKKVHLCFSMGDYNKLSKRIHEGSNKLY